MRTFRQRGGGLRQRPVAVGIGGDRAHQRGTVVDTHRRIGFGGTAQRWSGVVGRVIARHRPGNAAHVVYNRADDRRGWRGGIHVDHIPGGRCAGVARRIGGSERQAVLTIAERR